jgi:parallel beta-helix repeat protein
MHGSVSMRFPVKKRPLLLVAIFLGFLALKATASTDIQSAVNETTNGDLVLVNDGIYQSGDYMSPGGTYCVVATNTITLQSINGPAATWICGSNSVGGIYLASGALLSGFTLTNRLVTEALAYGRGVYCASTDAIVTNCLMINNFASVGGGAYSGTLINCTLQGNSGVGAGAAYSALFNCAILGNQGEGSGYFGGAYDCTLSNCIVAGNTRGGVGYCTLEDCTIESNTFNLSGSFGGGATQSTLNNCLLCNNQNIYGGGSGGGACDCVLNFCIVSNNIAYQGGGADYDSGQTSAPGQSNIVIGNIATGGNGGGIYVLGTSINLEGWTFISNSATGNGGGYYGPPISDCTFVGNVAAMGGGAYADLSNCSVIGNKASYGGGVYGTANNCIINSNVATNNGGGLYYNDPFPSTIYSTTGCAFTNNSALNGGGAYSSESGFSNCVFWANSATNNGGGVGASEDAQPADCVIGNNYAGLNGGGVYDSYGGSLGYCVVSGNTALNDGGGAYNSSMTNCLVYGNSAAYGGGAFYENPFLAVIGCTIAGNSAADNGGGVYGQTDFPSSVINCIIYGNSAPTNMNYAPTNAVISPYYSCTVPLTLAAPGQSDSDCTNDPAFVNAANGNFHLQSNSPCINSGYNAFVAGGTDLDGNPRIVGGTVDMGAYEYQTPVSMTSYYWLQQYGLPITTNTDTSNLDGTAFDVYQDWIAGLNPTNPASVLVMMVPPAMNNSSGITVTWQSVTNITYNLQRATNLTSAWTTIQANIRSLAGTTSYLDGSATNSGPYFYRVAVP